MKASFNLLLQCACGHQRTVKAEDIPAAWLSDENNIRQAVYARMLCLSCGRRGGPVIHTHFHPSAADLIAELVGKSELTD